MMRAAPFGMSGGRKAESSSSFHLWGSTSDFHWKALGSNDPPISAGATLAGRYELISLIGGGGMGVVWRAKQLTTDKAVAIKFLRRDDDAGVARFLREAKLVAQLTHPNIVQVFDLWETPTEGSSDGTLFMVMELLEGESLGAYLRRARKLSCAETLQLVVPVGRALRFSHARGVVHRDLKPDNVFLSKIPDAAGVPDGTASTVVKVVDFGLAKAVAVTSAITKAGSVGTPLYMAPEMVRGERVGVEADIWALGVIMYEMLVGHLPFDGSHYAQIFQRIDDGVHRPLHEAAPGIPAELADLVSRMLSRDVAARPNAAEVVQRLEDALANASTLSVLASDLEAPKWKGAGSISPLARAIGPVSTLRRSSVSLLAFAAGALVLLLAASMTILRPWETSRPVNATTVGTEPPPAASDPPVRSSSIVSVGIVVREGPPPDPVAPPDPSHPADSATAPRAISASGSAAFRGGTPEAR